MIHYVSGDILLSRTQALAHGVAPKDPMNQGLATGVGGLKWADVRPVVEDRLGALKIPVYVYSEFHAGQQAEEPGG